MSKPAARDCPYCAEAVNAKAKRCPHCHYNIPPPPDPVSILETVGGLIFIVIIWILSN